MEINKTGLTPVILSLNYDMMSYSYWTNSKENPSYYTKAALTYLSVFVLCVHCAFAIYLTVFYFPFSATCTGNPDLYLLLWQATQHDLPGVQRTTGPVAGPRGQERSVQGVRVRAQWLCHIVRTTGILSTINAVLPHPQPIPWFFYFFIGVCLVPTFSKMMLHASNNYDLKIYLGDLLYTNIEYSINKHVI